LQLGMILMAVLSVYRVTSTSDTQSDIWGTEDGFILVSSYQDEVESVEEPEKISTPKVTEKIEAEKDEEIVEVDVGEKIDEDKSVIEEKPKAKAAPKKEEKPKAKAAPKKEEKPKASSKKKSE